MRNLKRALSLALASVMLMGMMVVGSSAASFPDVDDENNVEAIAVLEAVKVMIGNEKGDFEPEKNVTRNEMAVIMAKLILGTYEADSYVGSHPFNDVPDWAQRYVAACYNSGIIAGRSDTTYDGNSTVTAVEAAAMMLRALGYEDLSKGAAQWDQPVAAKANEINLFKGLGGNSQTPMVRDSVAKLALNTLQADVVITEKEGDIEIPGTIVIPGKISYKVVQSSDRYASAIDGIEGTDQNNNVQLGEKLYKGDLKKNTKSSDDFDRPATEWTYKGREVVKAVNDADETYTKDVKLSDIYKDLGLGKAVPADQVDFSRNGKEEDVTAAGGKLTANNKVGAEAAAPDLDTLGLVKGDDHKIGANGVLTQVWYNAEKNTATITMIDTYVGKVASVTQASGSVDRYVTITPKPADSFLNTKFETEDFAAKDLISYTCAYNDSTKKFDVVDAKVLEKTATDTLTKWTGIDVGDSANSFTAGDTYKYSLKAYIDVDGTQGSIKDFTVDESELDIYCDDYGYAIYVSGVEGTKNYAVVIGKGETNPYGDQTTGVTLLLPDGTQKTVTAKWKTADNGSTVKLSEGTSTSAPVQTENKNLVDDMLGDVVTYKVDKDGIYELTMGGLNSAKTTATGKWDATTYDGDGDVTFVNGRSLLSLTGDSSKTIYTTEKTVFFVATKNSKNEVVYNVYTGYSEMPSLKTGTGTAVKGIGYVMNSDYTTQADAVFIAVDSVKGLSASQTFVVKQKNHEVITDSLGSYFEMPAIDADGNIITVMVDAKNLGDDSQPLDNKGDTQITGVVSMSDVTKNSNDIITGAAFDAPASSADFVNGKSYYQATGVVQPLNGVIGLGSDVKADAIYWAYTEGTKFYVVNEDMNKIDPVSAKEIVTDANDKVFFVADDDATASYKVVKTVIVQKVAEGTTPPPPPPEIASYSVGYLGNSPASKNVQIVIAAHKEDGSVDHWLSKAEIEALNITADDIYIENKGAEVKTKFGLGQEGTVYNEPTKDTGGSWVRGTSYKHQFDKSPLVALGIMQYDGYAMGENSGSTAINSIGYDCGFLKIHLEKELEAGALQVWLRINGEAYTGTAYTVQ